MAGAMTDEQKRQLFEAVRRGNLTPPIMPEHQGPTGSLCLNSRARVLACSCGWRTSPASIDEMSLQFEQHLSLELTKFAVSAEIKNRRDDTWVQRIFREPSASVFDAARNTRASDHPHPSWLGTPEPNDLAERAGAAIKRQMDREIVGPGLAVAIVEITGVDYGKKPGWTARGFDQYGREYTCRSWTDEDGTHYEETPMRDDGNSAISPQNADRPEMRYVGRPFSEVIDRYVGNETCLKHGVVFRRGEVCGLCHDYLGLAELKTEGGWIGGNPPPGFKALTEEEKDRLAGERLVMAVDLRDRILRTLCGGWPKPTEVRIMRPGTGALLEISWGHELDADVDGIQLDIWLWDKGCGARSTGDVTFRAGPSIEGQCNIEFDEVEPTVDYMASLCVDALNRLMHFLPRVMPAAVEDAGAERQTDQALGNVPMSKPAPAAPPPTSPPPEPFPSADRIRSGSAPVLSDESTPSRRW